MRILAPLLLVAACATGPALHEADFERIGIGMTQDEVRGTLGEPATRETFPRQGQVAWTYSFVDLWGYFAFCSVMFDGNGRVVGKTHTRKEPEDL